MEPINCCDELFCECAAQYHSCHYSSMDCYGCWLDKNGHEKHTKETDKQFTKWLLED